MPEIADECPHQQETSESRRRYSPVTVRIEVLADHFERRGRRPTQVTEAGDADQGPIAMPHRHPQQHQREQRHESQDGDGRRCSSGATQRS